MAAQIPARVKFRKMHRGSRAGVAWKGCNVSFGEYGLQALDRAWITTRQIEACRQTITRKMKRRGKVWIRIFPHKSYTKKPLEVRMGKGKANVEGWVAVVRPATMLFEVGGISEGLAKEALALAAAKLPIPTRLIKR
jgi:large subunit ribosomal protein L16|tara:strand:+ start:699 stop:1109 length:411 start_codon:yes stop_codon:yes gene_type:complete